VFHGKVDAVQATRQKALDEHYAAHSERYPKGPPKAHRPPAKVTINPLDAAPQTAEKVLAELTDAALHVAPHGINEILMTVRSALTLSGPPLLCCEHWPLMNEM
jgi:hypothetical protein